MKILFLTEYFYPFAHGGTEWSVYYLAKDLIKKGNQVYLLTPNFGSSEYEIWNGINIIRFPFPVKMKVNKPKAITPIYFTNVLFYLLTTIWVIKIVKKYNIDTIHAHGNYFLPSLYLSAKILNKKTVITLRDYQILCPYGFCLNKENKFHRCNWYKYFFDDFNYYLTNYCQKASLVRKVSLSISAVYAKINSMFLRFLLGRIDKVICISKKQAKIFKENNIKCSDVIYNSVVIENKLTLREKEQIFFAGRLTPGKGIITLIKSVLIVFKKYNKLKLVIAGDGILREEIQQFIKVNKLKNRIILKGQITHQGVLQSVQDSKLVVVPSIWEEPFGRVALEAQLLGVPVVVSNRGALPEIIRDKLTGYVVKTEVDDLARGINLALVNNQILRQNIKKNSNLLKKKFRQENLQSYINLYKNL